jgi:hypothetical protein
VTAGGSSGTGSGGGGSVPSNNSAPTISGTDTEGDVLTATTGSWSGSPTSYAYQWEDCNSSGGDCADVASGGTASTYTLTGSDVGDTIVVEVTATNGTGSSSPASSVATSVVASTSSVEVAVHNWFHGPNCGGGSTCTITPTFETAPATLSGSLSQSGTDYGFSNFFFGADYFEFSGTPGQQLVLNFTNSTDEYDPPGAPWPPMYYEFFDGSGNTVGYGEVYDAEGFNGACKTATADQPPGDYNGFGACEATFGSDGTLIVELENGDVVPYAGVTASITG